MIVIEQINNDEKIEKYLKSKPSEKIEKILNKYGQKGVEALRQNTPKDTGTTADSWSYRIIKEKYRYTLEWTNSNKNNGISVALLIQYGHATRNGGYIKGIDFINPAIQPIFKELSNKVWSEVVKL